MAVSVWRVLSVDDDPTMHVDLERVLSSRMGDNDFRFTTATSFDEGLKCMEQNRFDLVFLDVHEEGGDPDPGREPGVEDQRGEELLSTLKSDRFVPVVFYTGYPAKVLHLESLVVKVVDKGAPIELVRTAVSSILSTKLPHLSRHIEEQSRSYIWDSLQPLFETPPSDLEPSDLALLMARNLARNLSQQVIKQLLEVNTEVINPLEMYEFPPTENACNPADIIMKNDDETHWMVLTPACDFDQGKADNVLLARITPVVEHDLYKEWGAQLAHFNSLTPEKQRAKASIKPVNIAMDAVRRLVKGLAGERYKFLPGTFFLPDCVVDFQDLTNLPKEHADKFVTICALDNPYREEILHLFSKYYGRIGTPDYDLDAIWTRVEDGFKSRANP